MIDTTPPITDGSWFVTKPILDKSLESQIGILVLLTVLALGTIFMAVRASRTEGGRSYPYFIWIGGALAVLYEPLGDLLAHVTYHEVNQIGLVTAFGFKAPLWDLPAYVMSVSGAILWNMQRISSGLTMRSWMVSYFICIIGACLFELPMIALGYVEYYPPQPLAILGYPISMGFVNAAALMFTPAVILHYLANSVIGQRWPITFMFLVPMLVAGSHLAAALPLGWALNSGQSPWVINLASGVSALYALLQVWVGGQLVTQREPRT
jgi:hypothetical protein